MSVQQHTPFGAATEEGAGTVPPGAVTRRSAAMLTAGLTRAGWLRRHHVIKGDAGAVIVIGGSSRYPGPPILAVRAAARTGIDDARAVVPTTGWGHPLRADVHINRGGTDELDPDTVAAAVTSIAAELLPRCHPGSSSQVVLLIGPGMGGHPCPDDVLTALSATRRSLGAALTVVVDGHLGGGQLGAARLRSLTPDVVLLSHREATELLPDTATATIAATAAELRTVLVVKGAADRIVTPTSVTVRDITDGARQLTKSGTGDVLAGAVAGLLAHGVRTELAAEIGCWLIQAASRAARDRHGPGFLPSELADHLSTALLAGETP